MHGYIVKGYVHRKYIEYDMIYAMKRYVRNIETWKILIGSTHQQKIKMKVSINRVQIKRSRKGNVHDNKIKKWKEDN